MASVEDFSCLPMMFAPIQYHVSTPYRHQTSESTPQDFPSNYLFLCYHTYSGRNLTYRKLFGSSNPSSLQCYHYFCYPVVL